jgi:copper chaperone CopZ
MPVRIGMAGMAEGRLFMSQFRVPDIHCDGCIRALTGAVKDLDDKATLHADLTTKLVRVDTSAGDAAVAEAMRDAGFTVEAAW